jgi:hypothetical protein
MQSARPYLKRSGRLAPEQRSQIKTIISIIVLASPILDVQGSVLTMNHYFADNLRKACEDRIKKRRVS